MYNKNFRLIESYSEEDYNLEELLKMLHDKMRKRDVCVAFITQKPVYNEDGNVIGITTDFPARLNIYQAFF